MNIPLHHGVRSSLLVLSLLFALFSTTPCPAGEQEAWLDWVGEQAVFLQTVDWRSVDPAKLAVLDKTLKDKRIIFLGEPDHYVKEKYDFRLIFIRYLQARGWHHIGMEMGSCDGNWVDRFLETGDQGFLDQVEVLGYKGNRREDREYKMQGFDALKNEDFKQRYKMAEFKFFDSLYGLNAARPAGRERLHWFGYDVDVVPGGGYPAARVLLAEQGQEPLVKEILARLGLVAHESVRQEEDRLQKLQEWLETRELKLGEILGAKNTIKLQRIIRELVRSLRFFQVAQAGPSGGGWLGVMRERETWMFQRMEEKLAELPEDAKIILMGHNYHLSKDSDHLDFSHQNTVPQPMWKSIGTYLARTRPGEVYSLWMLYDRGRRGNIRLESGFQRVASDPGRIEHLLARAGSVFLLPLPGTDPREAYLNETVNFVQNGSAGSGLLNRQADALFFVDEVTVPPLPER